MTETPVRIGVSLRERIERKGKLLAYRLAGGVFSQLMADLIEEEAARQIPIFEAERERLLRELEQATNNREESRVARLRAAISKIRHELEILRDRDYYPSNKESK